MAVDIYIARHGQNEDNAHGILNGHRDLPLTDIGRRQAEELGNGILQLGLRFDKVYSSPLSRAFETAGIICKVAGIEAALEIIPEMIERDFGSMTGKPISQIETICGDAVIKTNTITYFLNPPGAETFPQLLERGHRILNIIREKQVEGNALLVCHGDVGKMIYAAATGLPWRSILTDFHFGNCELIEVNPNDQAHLIKLDQYNL